MTETNAATPLRRTRTYTAAELETIRAVRERAAVWIRAEAGRSMRSIAAGTNYSYPSISLFLAENYDGNNVAVAQSIAAFLDREENVIEVKIELEPVEFPSWKTVIKALDIAKRERSLADIYGDPGVGKTFPVEFFAGEDPEFNVLLRTTAGMHSLQAFLAILNARLAKTQTIVYSRLEKMADEVINSLIRKPRFIIVNEGQRLSFDVFDFACDVQEAAGCGIAFVGHPIMHDKIVAAERHDSQTYDRVDRRISHTEVKRGKIEPDLMGELVRQILPEITDDALSFLCDEILFPQIGHVVATCQRAKTLAALSKKGRKQDRALIVSAAADRKGGA
jgi:DNA transposition AAA+ family ATPase